MTRRSWMLDSAIALLVAALGIIEASGTAFVTHREGPPWVQGLLYVVSALLLVIRRVRPLGCLAAIVAVSLVEFALVGSPEGLGVLAASGIATYTVASRLEPRRSWWGLVLAVVLYVGWVAFDPQNTSFQDRIRTLVWLSPWVIAWLVGALVRTTRLAAEQRRLARENRQERAVADERNRIARELHDVIGHSVSVMTVQAAAVRRRLSPEQEVERQALETVESVGREALTEMRRMVGVLRQADDPVDRDAPPGLARVDELVGKFRTAGLPVQLQVTGDSRPLPPGLDLTVFRLLQEGLTNALRHAEAPSVVDVEVEFGADTLRLAVTDDGHSASSDDAGNGLLGMRERVAVYGGDLVAGTRPGGGFALTATLPLESASAPGQPAVERS